MAYSLLLAVGFGSTKTGLTTVGYQLKNADGTNNGTRISGASIKEIGAGYYQATVSIPDGHTGGILWDTGEGTPKYVYQDINPGIDENTDAKVTTRLATSGYTAPDNTSISAIKTVTDKFLFDASNFVKSVQQGAVDILQTAADKVWSSTTRTLTSFGTLISDIWSNVTRTLTSGAAPSVQDIDTALTASHGTGSWQTGLGGTGTNTVTITLTEAGGTPKIPGATVSVKNQVGDTLLATGTTDSNGQVQFMLNDGTYSVYKQKLGSYSFTNPETLIVSGNTNQTYIGTPISVSAPAQPNTCRMFIWARNPDGTLMTSLTGNIKIVALPYKYSGAAHKGDEISFTKHNDGYWYADIVYGATVNIYVPACGINLSSKTVPSQTTKDIGDWL